MHNLRKAISIASLLSLVSCAGCGTFATHGDDPVQPSTGVYRGVRADWFVSLHGSSFAFLDLPFSAVGDTFMLPHDLKRERGDKLNSE